MRALQGQLADQVAKRDLLNKELASTSPLIVTETEAAAGGPGAGRRARDPASSIAPDRVARKTS